MGWPYQQKPPMGWPLDYDSGLVPDVGFWPMQEGSGNIVQDLSGNGNTGTFVNSPIWVPGGIQFDIGDSDYISTPIFPSSPFTTVCRVKFKTIPNGAAFHLMGVHDGGDHRAYWGMYEVGDKWYIGCGDTVNFDVAHGLSAGVTYDIAMVMDGSNCTMFVNGIATAETFACTFSGTSTYNYTIAIRHEGGGYDNPMDATFYHHYYYNRALSASEIALLHQKPFCMFKDPAEIALLGAYQVSAGIPIFRRRRAG